MHILFKPTRHDGVLTAAIVLYMVIVKHKVYVVLFWLADKIYMYKHDSESHQRVNSEQV